MDNRFEELVERILVVFEQNLYDYKEVVENTLIRDLEFSSTSGINTILMNTDRQDVIDLESIEQRYIERFEAELLDLLKEEFEHGQNQ